MLVKSCLPVIPSADLERSLRCMVHHENLSFWLNERKGSTTPPGHEGIRLYWAPGDLLALVDRLRGLGFNVSGISERDYGQTEFFVTDDDGYSHCFGIATNRVG